MTQPIRVFIADDDIYLLDGLKVLLSQTDDIKVVGSATHPGEALEGIYDLVPDVAIIDLFFENELQIDGLDIIRQIREEASAVKCLILSGNASYPLVSNALRLDAKGYLYKYEAHQQALEAVRSLAQGKLFLSQKALENIVSTEPATDELTETEMQVLNVLAQTGATDKEIGHILYKSSRTVSTHISNIIDKLRHYAIDFQGQSIPIDSRVKIILWWLKQKEKRTM